jgi:hypothetical protein
MMEQDSEREKVFIDEDANEIPKEEELDLEEIASKIEPTFISKIFRWLSKE